MKKKKFNLTHNQRNPNQNNKMQFLPISQATFSNDSPQFWQEAAGGHFLLGCWGRKWDDLSGKQYVVIKTLKIVLTPSPCNFTAGNLYLQVFKSKK